MAGLGYTYDEIKREVARFWGYQGSLSTLSPEELSNINSCVKRGLSRAYKPPPLPDPYDLRRTKPPHDWSFLHPATTITTVVGQAEYTLDADFRSFDGPINFPVNGNLGQLQTIWPITPEDMAGARQMNTGNGYPYAYCVQPIASDGTAKQRTKLTLWYPPYGVWELQCRMRIMPDNIDDTAPYPYGGDIHGGMFLYACLSIAEEQIYGTKGAMWQQFLLELQGSIVEDNRQYGQVKANWGGGNNTMWLCNIPFAGAAY